MKYLIAATVSTVLIAPASHAGSHASGDAAAGENVFKKCRSCHMIESADGEKIQRGGRTGPNLWGMAGRQAGTVDGFRYSDLLSAAGEGGLTWDEESFVGYLADPTGYLQEVTGDGGRGKMTFKLRNDQEAADVWAYIVSVSPDP